MSLFGLPPLHMQNYLIKIIFRLLIFIFKLFFQFLQHIYGLMEYLKKEVSSL